MAGKAAAPPKPRARPSGAPPVDYAGAWEKTRKAIAAAVAAGTHSATVRALCRRCRQWCNGHYHDCSTGGGTGVAGRMEVCKACWTELYPKAAAELAEKQRQWEAGAFQGTRLYSGDPT